MDKARVIKIPSDNADDKKYMLIFLTNLSTKEFNRYQIAGLWDEKGEIENYKNN